MPPSRRRVYHVVTAEQEEPVAVIFDVVVVEINAALLPEIAAMGAGGGQEAEVAADGGSGGIKVGEEFRELVLVEVDEEAGEREREQVGAQHAVAVDSVAPGPADAPGGGEPARRNATEDVGYNVVRQAR
jgi:hypothetical protein